MNQNEQNIFNSVEGQISASHSKVPFLTVSICNYLYSSDAIASFWWRDTTSSHTAPFFSRSAENPKALTAHSCFLKK